MIDPMMMERVCLDPLRMGDHLVVSENQNVVTQTGQTQNFEGAWILGSQALSRGRWVCEFIVERRKRWMAVGFALDSIKLNRPINRTNIFVYASTGSIKANDHTTRENAHENDDEDVAHETNSAWSSFGAQYKTHDVVRAHLDMDLGVLGFSMIHHRKRQDENEEQHPQEEEEVKDAYVRLRGQKLFPAIYICGQGDSVRFKCSRVMDPIENPSFLPFLDTPAGDELGADVVTFVVQGRRIKAHKFLLTARSQYFKTMINNHQRGFASLTSAPPQTTDTMEDDDDDDDAADNDDDDDDDDQGSSSASVVEKKTAPTTSSGGGGGCEIPITGAEYDTFSAVLKFIYSGGDPEEIPPDHIVDVFKLASEYTLRPLALRCLDIMENSVTPENALSLFSLCEAHLPLTAQLKRRCVEVIRDNVKTIANSPSFNDLCTHPSLVKALVVPLCSPPPSKRQRTDVNVGGGGAASGNNGGTNNNANANNNNANNNNNGDGAL